ncbi:site-specific DNA-methyltransferase [Eubacteriales bacterium OttesenSCG-928-A19]|nr:site-specific DNA-methyltransferase [Eubacteriales bacterium OttesenSCG-928-A19]
MTNPFHVAQGDALLTLRVMEPGSVDAIITDPPYASGGMSMGEKSKSTRDKYTSYGEKGNPYPDFSGDALAQRAWTSFMHEILVACRGVTKAGGVLALFIDWRQLPALSDAMQWAGWTWRGVAVWDKMNARPQKGRFRQQTEFILWGSNGAMPTTREAPVLPGLFSYPNVPTHERLHQTQKPLALMRQVVQLCEVGGTVLDPFAGSGSTLEAALMEGYRAVGIEQEAHNVEIIRKRLAGVQGNFLVEQGEQMGLME